MNQGLLLTINLRGQISGPTRHTDKQSVTVDVSPVSSSRPIFETRKILHNDRFPSTCVKKMKISEESVDAWQSSECPFWAKPVIWTNATKKQRLEAHLSRFDEGYGYSYQFITKE